MPQSFVVINAAKRPSKKKKSNVAGLRVCLTWAYQIGSELDYLKRSDMQFIFGRNSDRLRENNL